MKATPQEELIDFLQELDYYDLKVAVGSGIPGHAQPLMILKLKELRDKIDQYVRHPDALDKVTLTVEDNKFISGADKDDGNCITETKPDNHNYIDLNKTDNSKDDNKKNEDDLNNSN
jgi:hypothetical protein